jgi:hypothetical protein
MLTYLLTTFPERLRAERVCTYVFRVAIANPCSLDPSPFSFTLPGARPWRLSSRFRRNDAFKPRRQAGASRSKMSHDVNAPGETPGGRREYPRTKIRRTSVERQASVGLPHPGGARYESPPPLPADDTPSLVPPAAASTPTCFPYLAAALKPPVPLPPIPRKTPPPLSGVGCFWCLSLDHNIEHCRDPVRCRRCRGSGHRQHRCKMPIHRDLTPWLKLAAATVTGSASAPSRSPPPSASALVRSRSFDSALPGAGVALRASCGDRALSASPVGDSVSPQPVEVHCVPPPTRVSAAPTGQVTSQTLVSAARVPSFTASNECMSWDDPLPADYADKESEE